MSKIPLIFLVFFELLSSVAIADLDSDQDGIDDSEEFQFGTDPLNADSDFDGLSDGFETDTASSWEIIKTDEPVVFEKKMKNHGDKKEYEEISIPSETDNRWKEHGDIISFDNHSTMCDYHYGCKKAGEFTFFQTFLALPNYLNIESFVVDIGKVDDGVRVTIFNQLYPNGITPESAYAFFPKGQTSDLTSIIIKGKNRIVLTHVDDCCVTSSIENVTLLINGIHFAQFRKGSGTNPLDSDSDHDGLSDFQEFHETGTDPNTYDTDNDVSNDYDERIAFIAHPSINDNDNLLDGEEVSFGTNSNQIESDSLLDGGDTVLFDDDIDQTPQMNQENDSNQTESIEDDTLPISNESDIQKHDDDLIAFETADTEVFDDRDYQFFENNDNDVYKCDDMLTNDFDNVTFETIGDDRSEYINSFEDIHDDVTKIADDTLDNIIEQTSVLEQIEIIIDTVIDVVIGAITEGSSSDTETMMNDPVVENESTETSEEQSSSLPENSEPLETSDESFTPILENSNALNNDSMAQDERLSTVLENENIAISDNNELSENVENSNDTVSDTLQNSAETITEYQDSSSSDSIRPDQSETINTVDASMSDNPSESDQSSEINDYHAEITSKDRDDSTQNPFEFKDSDQDGLSDAEETIIGTSPFSVDSDNDTLTDLEEIKMNSDPLAFDYHQSTEKIDQNEKSSSEQNQTNQPAEEPKKNAEESFEEYISVYDSDSPDSINEQYQETAKNITQNRDVFITNENTIANEIRIFSSDNRIIIHEKSENESKVSESEKSESGEISENRIAEIYTQPEKTKMKALDHINSHSKNDISDNNQNSPPTQTELQYHSSSNHIQANAYYVRMIPNDDNHVGYKKVSTHNIDNTFASPSGCSHHPAKAKASIFFSAFLLVLCYRCRKFTKP